jgi:hypothetical protein
MNDNGTIGITENTSRSHSALVEGMLRLEAALAAPAPGREQEWAQRILGDLHGLVSALEAHGGSVEAEEGLYDQVADALPEMARRVTYLRDANAYLEARARLLLQEVNRVAEGEGAAFMAVRSHAGELMTELRQQQSREVDLIFEVFKRDISGMD